MNDSENKITNQVTDDIQDDLDLKIYVDGIVKDKKIAFTLPLLSFAVVLIISLFLPVKYTSYAVLKISDENSSSNLGSSFDQFSAVGSLVGFDTSSLENSSSKYVVEKLKSKDLFFESLDEESLRNIYAAKSYNKETEKIILDSKYFDEKDNFKVNKIPNLLQLHRENFLKNFNASIEKDTGFIYVTYSHISPVFAKELIEKMINELNESEREKNINESIKIIEDLTVKIASTYESEVKKLISNLIENELKSQVLSNVKENFIVEYIDSPFIPDEKTSPYIINNSILGFIVGLFAFLIISISRSFIRTVRR